jgi:hypothetical protein
VGAIVTPAPTQPRASCLLPPRGWHGDSAPNPTGWLPSSRPMLARNTSKYNDRRGSWRLAFLRLWSVAIS